jgi:hypothetical protein
VRFSEHVRLRSLVVVAASLMVAATMAQVGGSVSKSSGTAEHARPTVHGPPGQIGGGPPTVTTPFAPSGRSHAPPNGGP